MPEGGRRYVVLHDKCRSVSTSDKDRRVSSTVSQYDVSCRTTVMVSVSRRWKGVDLIFVQPYPALSHDLVRVTVRPPAFDDWQVGMLNSPLPLLSHYSLQ